jgi:hypothetical protein
MTADIKNQLIPQREVSDRYRKSNTLTPTIELAKGRTLRESQHQDIEGL